MASVPAENTAAALPLVQTTGVPVPVETGFQAATAVLQVPFGVAVPVPAVFPFVGSQKGSSGTGVAEGSGVGEGSWAATNLGATVTRNTARTNVKIVRREGEEIFKVL